MKIIWQWGGTLGSIVWVISVIGWLMLSVNEIARILNYLMESVALGVGIVYCGISYQKIRKYNWRIIFAELGILLLVVMTSWGLLLGLTGLALGTDSRMVRDILNELTQIDYEVGIKNGIYNWIVIVILKMLVSMSLPVVLLKVGIRVFDDYKKQLINSGSKN